MTVETADRAVEQSAQERPFVFMGGLGYDESRNREVATAIISLTKHSGVITIPDTVSTPEDDGVVVYRYPQGNEQLLPGKVALKHLDEDPSSVRYTKLHENRAEQLIAKIQSDGGFPVDAVFQSVDVSTGLLAMHKRPDLFRKVVLLDPSSIIKLPPRLKYLREEWRSGNLFDILKRRKNARIEERFENPVSKRERVARSRRSNRGGNQIASYISSQAPMLHEIAQREDAPNISIVTSRFDHAYTPQRLLEALVSLDDVSSFYITNYRHGLGGKKAKLEQLVGVLTEEVQDKTRPFTERLRFAEDITDEYKRRIMDIVTTIRK